MEGKIMNWRTSTRSSSNGGECVEVADDSGQGVILVRDTRNRESGALAFGAGAWAAFLASIR